MPTRLDIENSIRILLIRYNAEYALLFGSYARGEETADSDVDVLSYVTSIEKNSNHPIANAIVDYGAEKNTDVCKVCRKGICY